MMHERLRKSARWVYLGLALVFAVSFVVAGVGTGGPALSDLIQNQQDDENNTVATSSDSLKDAQAAVDASPDDPQAWLALADAQRGEGDLVKASASADKAISLAKDDPDVNEAAAEIYSARAADNQTKANQIFTRYQAARPATSLPAYVYPGAADVQDPLSLAAQNASQQQLDALLEQAQPFQDAAAAASKQAADALDVVTTAHPDDAGAWFNLGVAASAANDTATAIKAFDMFLELAPGDPLADQVRSELLRLDPSRASTAAGTGTDAGATGTDTAATDTAAARARTPPPRARTPAPPRRSPPPAPRRDAVRDGGRGARVRRAPADHPRRDPGVRRRRRCARWRWTRRPRRLVIDTTARRRGGSGRRGAAARPRAPGPAVRPRGRRGPGRQRPPCACSRRPASDAALHDLSDAPRGARRPRPAIARRL